MLSIYLNLADGFLGLWLILLRQDPLRQAVSTGMSRSAAQTPSDPTLCACYPAPKPTRIRALKVERVPGYLQKTAPLVRILKEVRLLTDLSNP